MKEKLILVFTVMISIFGLSYAQELQSLDQELKRLKTGTALIPSQAVDEYPLWSPEADFIAVNVMGKWYKVNLTNITLELGTWRGKQRIGVINSKSSISEASREETEEWSKGLKFGPREVMTGSGTKIELIQKELSTSLVITKNGLKPHKVWSTDLENCHSLVLSPDEKYVAFISEMNGVVIMKLDSINLTMLAPYTVPRARYDPSKYSDRLVTIRETNVQKGEDNTLVTPANFYDWRKRSQSFEEIAIYKVEEYNFTGKGQPEKIRGYRTSANFFSALGIYPYIGREFQSEEEQLGKNQVVIISHRFWERLFGRDPSAMGQRLTLDSTDYTVVAIMPPSFDNLAAGDLWTPLALVPDMIKDRQNHLLDVIARLKPGISLNRAQAEMNVIARKLEQLHPKTNKGWRVRVIPFSKL